MTWAFTTGHAGYWQPVTWISLMIDAQVWGLDPRGFHLTNLILHVVNAALLFLVLQARAVPEAPGEPPRSSVAWRLTLEKTAFFVAAEVFSVVAFEAQRRGGAMTSLHHLSTGALALVRPRIKKLVAVGTLVSLMTLMVLARGQVRIWDESLRLFQHAIEVTRRNWVVHFNLSDYWADLGRLEDAAPGKALGTNREVGAGRGGPRQGQGAFSSRECQPPR